MTEKKSGSSTTRVFIKDNYVPTTSQKNYTPGTIKPDANQRPTSESAPSAPAPAPKKK